VTNAGEIRRCATVLNSGDVATLLSGTQLALEERRHSFLRPGTQIGLRKKFGCAAYIAGSNSERSGIVRWKNNGTGNDTH
jgi:hypothetical protein